MCVCNYTPHLFMTDLHTWYIYYCFNDFCLVFYCIGNEWVGFAWRHGNEWGTMYTHYLDTPVPLLIIEYYDLNNLEATRSLLLKVSSFLHVPIRSSILQCVVERASPLLGGSALVGPPGETAVEASWPRPSLKTGFQPFTLLTHHQQAILDNTTKDILARINLAKEQYRPKIR